MAQRSFRVALFIAAAVLAASGAVAESPVPGEAWKSSPHHGVLNGANGKPIPCICRFNGQDFRLGAAVCMNTHVGTVIARCDLFLNNTSWVPTDEPCVVSALPGATIADARAQHR